LCVNIYYYLYSHCSIIDTGSSYYWFPFLSEHDPDLLIAIQISLDDHFELVLWHIGQEKKVISLGKVIDATVRDLAKVRSEHVTKVKGKTVHHWLSFEVNREIYFIDLTNTSYKIKMPLVADFKWIPNESTFSFEKFSEINAPLCCR
jgi:hypothetical protein